jgi:hypothetical protein
MTSGKQPPSGVNNIAAARGWRTVLSTVYWSCRYRKEAIFEDLLGLSLSIRIPAVAGGNAHVLLQQETGPPRLVRAEVL